MQSGLLQENHPKSAQMNEKFNTDKVLSDYAKREPDQADTWNPLFSQFELSYRFSLSYALIKAIESANLPLEEFKVLDLGCGNARSTRGYLDLGLKPEQLTGLDVRPGTIELAKKIHPTINFLSYDGQALPFECEHFNWIQVAAVFSSVTEQESRQYLAKEITDKLTIGGYVFYYDLYRANAFAGDDLLSPIELFSGRFEKVRSQFLRCYQFIPSGSRFKHFDLRGLVDGLVKGNIKGNIKNFYPAFSYRVRRMIEPTHQAVLLRKLS